jgi:hypothetical protein
MLRRQLGRTERSSGHPELIAGRRQPLRRRACVTVAEIAAPRTCQQTVFNYFPGNDRLLPVVEGAFATI